MKIKLNRLVVSGLWTFIVLSILFNDDIYMYVALVLSAASLAFCVFRYGYKLNTKINLYFGGIIGLYIIGLIWNFTEVSIRNCISLIAIIIVFNLLSIVLSNKYNMKYLIYTCVMTLVILVFFSQVDTLGNTTGGFVMFISMCAIMQIIEERKSTNIFSVRVYYAFLAIIIFALAAYMTYKARARTALFVGVVIILTYIILKRKKIKNSYTKREFYIVLLIGMIAIVSYISITTFEWYSYFNSYSVAWFGKNIDSSRPQLWRESLEAVGRNPILGLGTGIQPKDLGNSRFDSFHNSFIQLLVQNGLVALICFIYILSEVWATLRARIEEDHIKFAIACFIGILIYNCFETTLLSNKLTLGISQWIILVMGYAKSKQIYK